MGYFSWMFADRNNERALKIGKKAYLLIPTEKDRYYEGIYDGYGNIGSLSVYEQVALWNREYLTIENLEKPERERFGNGVYAQEAYEKSMKSYEQTCACLSDFVGCMSVSEMKEKYGKDYLRELGIEVACYDWQNEQLKYPIKICELKTSAKQYDILPASKRDPNQGCC